jgi:hypothetical protein
MQCLIRASLLGLAGLVSFSAISQAQYTIQPLQLNQDNSANYPVQFDWNHDGIPDFLASGDTNQNLISNSATGTYTYQTAPGLEGAIGDFNNDGKIDYAFASINYFYLYYGNGRGGFTQGPSSQGAPGVLGCLGYVVADFNGDGRQDIAGAFETGQTSTTGGTFGVALYLNNGDGFNTGKIIFQSTIPANNQGGWPYTPPGTNTATLFFDFAIGDFDSDGHADLMFRTMYSSENTPQPIPTTDIRVLYGDGHGNFTARTVTTDHTLDQVSVADMNNDGSTDIVALKGDTTTIYYGHPNRSFTSASVSSPGGDYLQPMLVDVTGDGLKDIIYLATCPANYTCPDGPTGQIPTGIITLVQTPSHAFTSTGFKQVQDVFSRGFIGDYNHDGKLDAALFTGQEENSDYQLNDHLYLIKNMRNISALCPAPASPGFHVCSPSGASVASPVKFNFSASSLYPIRKMEVWIDGTKRSETYNTVGQQAFANPSLSLSAGTHKVSLFSGAYDGSVQKTSYSLTVK